MAMNRNKANVSYFQNYIINYVSICSRLHNFLFPKIFQVRLPPEVNRVLYVRNLPYKITAEEMYDIFGKYGAIRQIRVGNTQETRGTAFVVYEDIFDAKNACDHLSGFNVCNRYLVVLYYQANKAFKKIDADKKEAELMAMKAKYGLSTPGRETQANAK